ncbi:MAG: hypothetical protein V1857_06055 [archaeon]
MHHRIPRKLSHIPLRSFDIVIDIEDPFAPELTVEDYMKEHGSPPEPPRYRIVSVELVTCPEDNQPVLVTECGSCPGFVRRFKDRMECTKAVLIE